MNDHLSVQSLASSHAVYITLAEAARLSSLSRHTLYHWIRDGKLNKSSGLRRAGSRHMIEWLLFKAAIDAGEFE
jgi:predicted DNA-binding transcriptional regulator AlpA